MLVYQRVWNQTIGYVYNEYEPTEQTGKSRFFSHVVVSINGGTPKSSSVFIEFSLINHSFLGIPHLWNPLRIQLQWTLYTCFITISPWYPHDIPIIAIWHYIPFQKLQPYIYIYIMSIIKLIYCHYITIYIYISHLYIYIMSMMIAIYHWAPESLLGIIENMGSPAVNQLRLVPLFRKIHMAGHPLFNNTPLENPIFWIQKLMENQCVSHTKSHESHWKTNGSKTFIIINLMNPIPNLINPIFGFAAHCFGGWKPSQGLDLLWGGGYYLQGNLDYYLQGNLDQSASPWGIMGRDHQPHMGRTHIYIYIYNIDGWSLTRKPLTFFNKQRLNCALGRAIQVWCAIQFL